MQAHITAAVVTAKTVDKTELTPQTEVWDKSMPAFGFYVGKTKRTYRYVGRVKGDKRLRKPSIGDAARLVKDRWTSEGCMTLAGARARANDISTAFRSGEDLIAREAREREAAERDRKREQRNTFGWLAAQYMAEDDCGTIHHREKQRKLDQDVLPRWRDMPIADIDRAAAKELLATKDKLVARDRLRQMMCAVFNWALDDELVSGNPFARLDKRKSKARKSETAEKPRDRWLSKDEIRRFWNGLSSASMDEPTRLALKFLLVTGQRRTEATHMAWTEIDFEENVWIIPDDREGNKRGIVHVVPLSDLALEVLAEAKAYQDSRDHLRGSQYVFPTRQPKTLEDCPMAGHSLSHAMRRNREHFGWSDDPKPPTPHSLRHTVGTHMARLKIAKQTISQIFNHAEGGITAGYIHHAELSTMQVALQSWANELRALVVGGERTSNVTDLRLGA